MWHLLRGGPFLLFLTCWEFLSWRDVEVWKMPLLRLLRWAHNSVLCSVHVVLIGICQAILASVGWILLDHAECASSRAVNSVGSFAGISPQSLLWEPSKAPGGKAHNTMSPPGLGPLHPHLHPHPQCWLSALCALSLQQFIRHTSSLAALALAGGGLCSYAPALVRCAPPPGPLPSWEQHFAPWPQFTDESKKSCSFAVGSAFSLWGQDWWLPTPLWARLETRSPLCHSVFPFWICDPGSSVLNSPSSSCRCEMPVWSYEALLSCTLVFPLFGKVLLEVHRELQV